MDRVDTAGVDAAVSTLNQAAGVPGDGELDVAMGTLMAYGGKYLRQIGLWAFEHATSTSCLLYTSPSPRDATLSRMQSSA